MVRDARRCVTHGLRVGLLNWVFCSTAKYHIPTAADYVTRVFQVQTEKSQYPCMWFHFQCTQFYKHNRMIL